MLRIFNKHYMSTDHSEKQYQDVRKKASTINDTKSYCGKLTDCINPGISVFFRLTL